MQEYREFPIFALRDSSLSREIAETGDYILEYFYRNKGFVPSNYAIGTKVVTA